MRQVFILSPAKTSGERAKLIYNPRANFGLAQRLHAGEGVSLGEVFSFLSGLYFRGKLTYSKAFSRPPRGIPGVLVITSHRGLLPADVPVNMDELRAFSEIAIELTEERYVAPLVRDADLLAEVLGQKCRIVF